MNRILLFLVVAVLLAASVGSGVYYFTSLSNSNNIVKPCPNSYNVGHYNLWGGGSSSCLFTITRDGILTGGFHSNATLDFFIQTSDQYQQTSGGSIPTTYVYELKNTSGTTLDVSLPAGSYEIEFYFTYSYRGYSAVNGTGDYGVTALNITQTFVVKD